MSYLALNGLEFAGLGDVSAAFNTGNAMADGLIARANERIAALLVPFHPTIDKFDMPEAEKEQIKTEPVTAFMALMQPLENVAAEVITLANRMSGKWVRNVGVPGVSMLSAPMDVDPPSDQAITSPSGKHFVRLLRIVNSYQILVVLDPGTLSKAFAQVAVKYGMQGAAVVQAKMFAASQQAAAMAQGLSQQGQQALQQGTQAVLSLLHLRGLGAAGADDATVWLAIQQGWQRITESAATAFVTATPILVSLAIAVATALLAGMVQGTGQAFTTGPGGKGRGVARPTGAGGGTTPEGSPGLPADMNAAMQAAQKGDYKKLLTPAILAGGALLLLALK